jgi:ribosomal subunit interface protein
MQIETNPGDGIHISEALRNHIRDRLSRVERRFGDRITRIEVYLKDVNARKGGVDKVCTLEAHPAGLQPVAVEADSEDVYLAVQDSARKLEKALEHRIARAEE